MADKLVQWLEAEKDKRGWGVRDLAREAGLTPAQVSDVLSGKSNPGMRFYLGMWRAFHVSIDYLLQLAGELPPGPEENPTLMEIMEIARRLPPDLQEDVRQYSEWRSQQAAAAGAAAQVEPSRA
jgi:transcriptional regulator with XRE-family HTH domain